MDQATAEASSNVTTLIPCDVPATAKPLDMILAEISADASDGPKRFLDQTKVPDGGE